MATHLVLAVLLGAPAAHWQHLLLLTLPKLATLALSLPLAVLLEAPRDHWQHLLLLTLPKLATLALRLPLAVLLEDLEAPRDHWQHLLQLLHLLTLPTMVTHQKLAGMTGDLRAHCPKC
jgi:hypothetical protein